MKSKERGCVLAALPAAGQCDRACFGLTLHGA